MIRATTNAGGKAQDVESLGGQDTSVATPQSPSGGTQKDRMMQLDDDRRTIPAPSIPNHPIPTIQLQPNRSDQPANNDSKSTTPKTDEPAKSGRDSTDVMTVARASRDGTDEKRGSTNQCSIRSSQQLMDFPPPKPMLGLRRLS